MTGEVVPYLEVVLCELTLNQQIENVNLKAVAETSTPKRAQILQSTARLHEFAA